MWKRPDWPDVHAEFGEACHSILASMANLPCFRKYIGPAGPHLSQNVEKFLCGCQSAVQVSPGSPSMSGWPGLL